MTAVPEDFLLFNMAMTSPTQPETSLFPQVYVWRSREYMYLWVTLDIVGLLYFSHSVWPVRLLG